MSGWKKKLPLSWHKEHRPIHEEAMMHFLDPEKKGERFVPKKVCVERNVWMEEKASSFHGTRSTDQLLLVLFSLALAPFPSFLSSL